MLLLKVLNFAPTPNWSFNMENEVWTNFHSHISQKEWANKFGTNAVDFDEKPLYTLPKRFKIPKILRLHQSLSDEETNTYCQSSADYC